MQESKPEVKPPKRPVVKVGNQVLKATQCMLSLLGETVDLRWNIEEGVMEVAPSKATEFSHTINGREEVFEAVPLRHSKKCPFLNPDLAKNEEAVVRPCVVVLIQNKLTKKILATQRHAHMSFGNTWVLPGGHLELGENVLLGGLRECEEEVGLKEQYDKLGSKEHDLMVWESVLVDEKLMKIKRAALVVFFRVECEEFEVVEQKSEVQRWEWRSFGPEESPWGGGWAEGHLRYLGQVSRPRDT